MLMFCLIVPNIFMLSACGHTHTLTKVDSVDATCTTAGNTLYYECECGKYFSDNKAENEIDEDSWVVASTGHSFESTWTYNNTHHWKKSTCGHTDEKSEYAEHNVAGGVCVCGYASTVYTVSEEVWKVNFNLIRGQAQGGGVEGANVDGAIAHQLKAGSDLTEITSYTLYAEGTNDGTSGTSLLKVTQDAMYIEFYVEGTLKDDESGIHDKTTDLYIGLTTLVKMYFPFANNYNDFTFDSTKNAYVGHDISSILIDEYDHDKTYPMYTKTAEVTFINGYLNTVSVELCNSSFTDVYATFEFTFSNINNTTIDM